jgi:hypothetical protein
MLMTKTKAPLVYITYRQPMLLSFVQMDVWRPVVLSIGFGQFHFAGAANSVSNHSVSVTRREIFNGGASKIQGRTYTRIPTQ